MFDAKIMNHDPIINRIAGLVNRFMVFSAG
jgi:hypothetical protein